MKYHKIIYDNVWNNIGISLPLRMCGLKYQKPRQNTQKQVMQIVQKSIQGSVYRHVYKYEF